MLSPSQCAAVIPCFNEAKAIASLISEIRRHVPQVVVVDDGSEDGTAELARQAGAMVHSQTPRQGKGAALLAGWSLARSQGFQWAMTMDGDGQHAPADIPAFLECARRTGAALVSGNRMSHPGEMPWVRRAVNRWMSKRLSSACGVRVPDSQCGFRLVNLEVLADLPIRAVRFEIESETLLAFARNGHRIEFVPIRVIYREERSKIHPVRDTWRWFAWWRQACKSGAAGGRAQLVSK